jgi:hypothetical protein
MSLREYLLPIKSLWSFYTRSNGIIRVQSVNTNVALYKRRVNGFHLHELVHRICSEMRSNEVAELTGRQQIITPFNTPLSYSVGPGLKSRPGDGVSQGYPWFSLVTTGKCLYKTLNQATTASFHVFSKSLFITYRIIARYHFGLR